MKLKTLPFALALGIVGAVCMLIITYYPFIAEQISGVAKGESIRNMMEDIYPFYEYGKWYAPITGAMGGFIDLFVFGILTGGLYNLFLGKKKKK
ncbi:hypothetical protein GF366_01325 [Candidatus Peregrinibacteria bacterium]|nr:hypothetical protein [Candidatus Peregrinibacteria bacterium]